MRPSTLLFSVLAVVAYSSPVPQSVDPLCDLLGLTGGLTGSLTGITGSLAGLGGGLGGVLGGGLGGGLGGVGGLGGLTDSLFSTVGDLLRAPLGLLGPLLGPGVQLCGFDAPSCVGTCTAECGKGAQACSDCLISCYNGQTPSSNNSTPTPDPKKQKHPHSAGAI